MVNKEKVKTKNQKIQQPDYFDPCHRLVFVLLSIIIEPEAAFLTLNGLLLWQKRQSDEFLSN